MCKWAQNPDEVEFALSVLERLAKRYGNRKGLFGIQPLNEPITENMWETMKVPERYPAVDPELAETMPQKLVAHTGMDAMTHAIEAYVSTANCDTE